MDSTEAIIYWLIVLAVLMTIGLGAYRYGQHLGRKRKASEQKRLWEEQHAQQRLQCKWGKCTNRANLLALRRRPCCGQDMLPRRVPTCNDCFERMDLQAPVATTCYNCGETSRPLLLVMEVL